jgi:hypothetical protein
LLRADDNDEFGGDRLDRLLRPDKDEEVALFKYLVESYNFPEFPSNSESRGFCQFTKERGNWSTRRKDMDITGTGMNWQ